MSHTIVISIALVGGLRKARRLPPGARGDGTNPSIANAVRGGAIPVTALAADHKRVQCHVRVGRCRLHPVRRSCSIVDPARDATTSSMRRTSCEAMLSHGTGMSHAARRRRRPRYAQPSQCRRRALPGSNAWLWARGASPQALRTAPAKPLVSLRGLSLSRSVAPRQVREQRHSLALHPLRDEPSRPKQGPPTTALPLRRHVLQGTPKGPNPVAPARAGRAPGQRPPGGVAPSVGAMLQPAP